jgi:hypothetical protein
MGQSRIDLARPRSDWRCNVPERRPPDVPHALIRLTATRDAWDSRGDKAPWEHGGCVASARCGA